MKFLLLTLFLLSGLLIGAAERAPFSLNLNWHLLRNPPTDVSLTAIPPGAEKVKLFNDVCNLGKAPARSAAVFYNEFEAPADGLMQVGMAADWWLECFLDGKPVFSTLPGGNGTQSFSPENHVFDLPVKKGRNLLAVRVLAGSDGWRFVCGEVPFRKVRPGIYEVKAGKEWRPVKMETVDWLERRRGRNPIDWSVRLDSIQVKPGTALDFSLLFPKHDIDKLGRVVVNRDGKLAFAAAPKQPVRFRGFNMVVNNGWRTRFNSMNREELEELAEYIRLRGMNVIRVHYLDAFLCRHHADPHQRPKRAFNADQLPATPEELPIDRAMLDRYDWFVKCLRDRGIYLLVDLANSKEGWSNFHPVPDAPADVARNRLYFDERYRKNWSAAAEFMLTRVNPHTGTRMKDDPQYIGVTFYNEQDIQPFHLEVFAPIWKERFPQYRSALTLKLLSGKGEESEAARKFILGLMADMNRFYMGEMKRLGFPGLLTNYDMHQRLMEIPARSELTATAMHVYAGAPSGVRLPLSTPGYQQKNVVYPWEKGKEFRLNRNSTITSSNWMGRAAMTRIAGKPFLLTEYAQLPGSRFAHEEGLMVGGFAALQGWDLLTPHSDTVRIYYYPASSSPFAVDFHPTVRASEAVTALAWQRGDVAEAKHLVDFAVTPEIVNSSDFLNSPGRLYNALSMLVKIGTSYPAPYPKAALTVTPNAFTPVISTEFLAEPAKEHGRPKVNLDGLVKTLRNKKLLPPGNRTDPEKGIYQSETGQLTFDTKNGVLTVVTPKLEGATVKSDQPLKLDALTIRSSSLPASITAASLDGAPLRGSKRILLVHATNAASEGTVYSNEFFDAEIEIGTFPMLIRSAKFAVELETRSAAAPKIYALNFDGTREKELPTKWQTGKLSFELDTSTLEYGTVFYEIVY